MGEPGAGQLVDERLDVAATHVVQAHRAERLAHVAA